MTPARYQPGGDIYATLESRYGTGHANHVAALARAGEWRALQIYLSDLKPGGYEPGTPRLNESTAGLFVEQITTDPLGAPLDAAEGILDRTLGAVVRNPLVLLAVIGLALWALSALGGLSGLKKRFT